MQNIISVAHFTNDLQVKKAILKSDDVRNEALNYCYNMPNYESLPLDEKNKVYDNAIKLFI